MAGRFVCLVSFAFCSVFSPASAADADESLESSGPRSAHHRAAASQSALRGGMTLAQAPSSLQAAVAEALETDASVRPRSPAAGPPPLEELETTLTVADGAASDAFGFAVDVDGDTAVVGAPKAARAAGANAGAVYVFVRSGDGWIEQQQLTCGICDERFGFSVAVDGDTLVVGVPYHDISTIEDGGMAVVFTRTGTTWALEDLLSVTVHAGDHFGWAVAVDGDTALVGMPLVALAGQAQRGAAWVFVRSGSDWTAKQRLSGPDPDHRPGYFGYSVAIEGDTAAAGAVLDTTDAGFGAGTTWVYVRAGNGQWNLQQRLFASDPSEVGTFGSSVAISANTLAVGAEAFYSDGVGAVYVFVRSAGHWSEQEKLTGPDRDAGDTFGISVDVEGNTLVAGSPGEDPDAGTNAGSVLLFTRSGSTWTLQQPLEPGDPAPSDRFGTSVAIDQGTVVAGASDDNTPEGVDAGSASVFSPAGSVPPRVRKLSPADGAGEDGFGWSLAMDGDTAVVGAPFDDTADGALAGSAYVLVRSAGGWDVQQKLTASDGASEDAFGFSVAADRDTVLVGAKFDDTGAGEDAGSAYVFVRDGTNWTEHQKLVSEAPAVDQLGYQFGYDVAISGNAIIIGAPNDDTAASQNGGAAYAFGLLNGTWRHRGVLTAGDAAPFDDLGWSVAVDGNTAVVGAPFDDTPAGADAGSAYVFVRSSGHWNEQQRLESADAGAGDWLGMAVAVDGDTVVAGAGLDDTAAGNAAGSASVFVRSGSTWTEQQKLLASAGAAGDRFGAAVAVDGDVALVGAFLDGTPIGGSAAGSASFFMRSGSTWVQQHRVGAFDAAPGEWFGAAVALEGDVAIVAAPLADTVAGADAGAVYVIRVRTVLAASDGAAGDYLGFAVAVDGNTAVVGARGDDIGAQADRGSAYVFVRSGSTWTQQQKLLSTDGGANQAFGLSVAIGGDTVVVGAYRDDTVKGTDAGSAYVFVRSGSTWTQQAQLTASDGATSDHFGVAVAVDADTAIVGAYHDNTPAGVDAGSAYVFTRSGAVWTERQKLAASDAAAGDAFGRSAAIDGLTAVIGSDFDDTPAGADSGSAYVFGRSGDVWSLQQKLTSSDLAAGDALGLSVAVDGATILVGAIYDDTAAGADAGSAYAFARSGGVWIQQQKLTALAGAPGARFGVSVGVSGAVAVVGADMADAPAGGIDAGSAYVFTRSGLTWTQRRTLTSSILEPGAGFGFDVAVHARGVIVGSRYEDTPTGADAGLAYVFAAPSISGVVPRVGVVGTPVVISGVGFTGANKVAFGAVAAAFTVVSDREILTTVPDGALTGRIRVTAPLGAGVSPQDFLVRPKIGSFSPGSGPSETTVFIMGSAFTGADRVAFGGVSAEFTVDSYSQITAVVPDGAVTGRISVRTPGGLGQSTSNFVVT